MILACGFYLLRTPLGEGARGVPSHAASYHQWSDLEIAFERNSPEQESFLDLENGDLLSIVEGEPDAAARRARVANNPDRYVRVDPRRSREQYRWMERFVNSVQDQPCASDC